MDYKSLKQEWIRYPRKWDSQNWKYSYRRSLDSGIWNDPNSYIEEKIDFLNHWKCRVDRSTAIPDLLEYSENFNNLLESVSSLELLRINHKNLDYTRKIYELLSNVNGLGPTGISKYMHMHKPELFIMWDSQIIRDYFHIKTVLKTTATSKKYSKFMLRMKNEIIEAIDTFSNYKNINNKQAIIQLRKCFNNETLPRILDKYNYETRGEYKRPIY